MDFTNTALTGRLLHPSRLPQLPWWSRRQNKNSRKVAKNAKRLSGCLSAVHRQYLQRARADAHGFITRFVQQYRCIFPSEEPEAGKTENVFFLAGEVLCVFSVGLNPPKEKRKEKKLSPFLSFFLGFSFS